MSPRIFVRIQLWTSMQVINKNFTMYNRGPGHYSEYSDSLQAGTSNDRIPVGARFSAPV